MNMININVIIVYNIRYATTRVMRTNLTFFYWSNNEKISGQHTK